MRFVDDFFPLLVTLQGAEINDVELREMAEGFERYFQRNERYAVLLVAPGKYVQLGARERKRITEWVNTPRVAESAKRLCVGSATVVPSAIAHGALTALLWFWTPPSPLRAVPTIEDGLDFCFRSLSDAKIPLRQPEETVRTGICGYLRAFAEYAPSFG